MCVESNKCRRPSFNLVQNANHFRLSDLGKRLENYYSLSGKSVELLSGYNLYECCLHGKKIVIFLTA